MGKKREKVTFEDEELVAAVRGLYMKYRGRPVTRIAAEVRAAGWPSFTRNIMYTRTARGKTVLGWIERFGWEKELKRRTKRREASKAKRLKDFEEWLPSVSGGMSWTSRHFVYICEQLRRVTSGEVKRMMLFMPPRHGKSELVTIRYALWRLLREPRMNIIIASYNQKLAEHFSRKIRWLAESCLEVSRSRNAVGQWETAAGGGVKAVGVGAGVTGFGGNLIIIDDPVKGMRQANSRVYRDRAWDWYRNDIYTRLEPNGSIILIQTRWHEDDLAGRLLKNMQTGGEQWEMVRLPALAEEGETGRKGNGETRDAKISRCPLLPISPSHLDPLDRAEGEGFVAGHPGVISNR